MFHHYVLPWWTRIPQSRHKWNASVRTGLMLSNGKVKCAPQCHGCFSKASAANPHRVTLVCEKEFSAKEGFQTRLTRTSSLPQRHALPFAENTVITRTARVALISLKNVVNPCAQIWIAVSGWLVAARALTQHSHWGHMLSFM